MRKRNETVLDVFAISASRIDGRIYFGKAIICFNHWELVYLEE